MNKSDELFVRNHIAIAVHTARMVRGITQAALAKKAEMQRTTIVNIECGTQGMTVAQLVVIARALDIKPRTLLSGLL